MTFSTGDRSCRAYGARFAGRRSQPRAIITDAARWFPFVIAIFLAVMIGFALLIAGIVVTLIVTPLVTPLVRTNAPLTILVALVPALRRDLIARRHGSDLLQEGLGAHANFTMTVAYD